MLVTVLIAVALSSGSAFALDTLPLLPEGPSRTLLKNKHPIQAETCGAVPVEYADALSVFDRPGLLQDVQDAYSELIMKGEDPEFIIHQRSANSYYYVNRDGERTDIMEVFRKQTSDATFDIIYYSAGRRSFGEYQAVIHVQISPGGEQETRYVATVYAYPANALSRFFARHLGLVERYFKKKTEDMAGIITMITCSICSPEEGDEPDRIAETDS